LKIQRAYKYRLFPTPKQEQNLRQQCGNCRFLWNKFLDLNKETYEATGKFVFGHALITLIPKLKQEYGFLSATFSQSLQQVGRHFDRALREFLDHKKEFPKYKKKKYRDGLTIPQKFRLEKTFVFIPKVGEIK
jgi:putative transposase